MKQNIIVWDLGATKCAAGLVEYDLATQQLQCKQKTSLKLTQADSFANLIHQIENNLRVTMSSVDAICVGAAGYFDGESLHFAGVYPYEMNFSAMAKQQSWPRYAVIHDYAPIVCATFTSYMQQHANVKYLNQEPMNPYGRRVALGIGTGLGVKDGVLLENGDFWLGKNEMGHLGVIMPPELDAHHRMRHEELVRFFHAHTPITFEKILSGQGTVRLHQFFYPSMTTITPEQVGEKMRRGEAKELMDAFAWYLGLFVGTVQLSFMPEGGVWMTGGVALNHLDIFDRPEFFAGIHASPAYLTQRQRYPLGVLCSQDHALMGGGYYAVKRLLNTY